MDARIQSSKCFRADVEHVRRASPLSRSSAIGTSRVPQPIRSNARDYYSSHMRSYNRKVAALHFAEGLVCLYTGTGDKGKLYFVGTSKTTNETQLVPKSKGSRENRHLTSFLTPLIMVGRRDQRQGARRIDRQAPSLRGRKRHPPSNVIEDGADSFRSLSPCGRNHRQLGELLGNYTHCNIPGRHI